MIGTFQTEKLIYTRKTLRLSPLCPFALRFFKLLRLETVQSPISNLQSPISNLQSPSYPTGNGSGSPRTPAMRLRTAIRAICVRVLTVALAMWGTTSTLGSASSG